MRDMITVHCAKAFPGIRIKCRGPGITATDLNHHTGTQTVEVGAEIIVRMARIDQDGSTGGFFDANGPVAWQDQRRRHVEDRARSGGRAETASP